MAVQTFEILLYIVCAFAFEDIVLGQQNQEMIKQGRLQYQLIKEKTNLPRYGPCWKAAVEHLDEGCKYLSEDTQSDIALHITNCFLEMSGHETYNCELDKKPNLRAICINSMSDRAFNVYTEFYTHTQNICWFLRGQIWQETLTENTLKVGKQLEVTALNQENLLRSQKESMELQEKMIEHSKNVLENLYLASKTHKDVLTVLARSVNNLQSWIMGEVSWIDSIIFYFTALTLTSLLTSTKTTNPSRIPIFIMIFINLILERALCSMMLKDTINFNVKTLYSDVNALIWYMRYVLVFISIFIFIYKSLTYRSLEKENNDLLYQIKEDNERILTMLDSLKLWMNPVKFINDYDIKNEMKTVNCFKEINGFNSSNNSLVIERSSRESSFSLDNNNSYNNVNAKSRSKDKDFRKSTRYNLRSSHSRHETPEC